MLHFSGGSIFSWNRHEYQRSTGHDVLIYANQMRQRQNWCDILCKRCQKFCDIWDILCDKFEILWRDTLWQAINHQSIHYGNLQMKLAVWCFSLFQWRILLQNAEFQCVIIRVDGLSAVLWDAQNCGHQNIDVGIIILYDSPQTVKVWGHRKCTQEEKQLNHISSYFRWL